MAVVGAALLAVLAGLAVKRKVDKAPPQSREDQAVVHLVQALGYDPAKVLVRLVRGAHPGVQIMDKGGKLLRFYTLKELRRRQRDPQTRASFGAAMRLG